VPNDDSKRGGFARVGRSGGEMKPDELWKRWIQGGGLPDGFEDRRGSMAWVMTRKERQSLVRQWQQEMFTAFYDTLQTKMHEFRETYQELQEIFAMTDAQVLRQHRIIGMTTTGA